jgi:hypothetical protein
MKKTLLISLLSVMMMVMMIQSGCTTAEFVWDPTGQWTITLDFYSEGVNCNESITLSGTESSGTVTGFTYCGWEPPQTGTFIKTSDYAITISFSWLSSWGEYIIVTLNLNSTEANPNSMTGTGSSQEDSSTYPCNIIGTKISNLQ